MVGHAYCGAFAYADDIALVAPTTHALKAMCDICTNFAHEYDIQFNTAKCQLFKYGESDDVPFYFNGTLIEYVRHGVHLGHSIGPNFVNSCLNSNNCILKLLSRLALQGSGSQMANNNCNLIKYVHRINSNDIVTGSSSVFRHLARNVYFAGLDVELLERAELLSDILWERDCEKTGDTQFMDFVIERLSAH